ncbi:MAG: cell division protein ZapE [Alphaproteobacteria bacterium]
MSASDPRPHDGPLRHYEARLADGSLQADPAQAEVIRRLQRLHDELKAGESGIRNATGGGLLKQVRAAFSRSAGRSRPLGIRGLYIHGPVGRGKSMAMDLFHASAPVDKKRRVHFHAFMQDVHRRLKDFRGKGGVDDAILHLADRLFAEVTLLCFDEFHVQNIADAMILGRLFGRLFDLGLVMVATSNFPPERLYENGLNRDRFLPFIARLRDELDVLSLESPTDYRLERLQNLPVYYCPDGPAAREAIAGIFALLTDDADGGAEEIEIGSRRLPVPKAARGVAWFDFAELCEQPLGAGDYLALAERYHTLILEGVPALTRAKHNEARRFMTLVDALYECRVNLIVSADAEPMALYQAGEGAFEFERTASRLMEMRSRDYIETPPSTIAAADFVPFALTTDLI